ncbi:MAG: TIGR02281 family clan AA aspartic protease [Gammaproteobacteria bacterium]|nr:TIGR02281 family clan AA aspartic protease [Gammaproteobacteria bacterium]
MIFRFALINIVVILTALFHSQLFANDTIVVNGLFKNKAVLLINGKQHILSIGTPGPGGITLIAIEGEKVTLSIDGAIQSYRLGESTSITTNYKQSDEPEVLIALNTAGQFLTVGAINKQPVQVLVDTGATSVALNSAHAKNIGLDYRNKGTPTMIATASGVSQAYRIILDEISIGEIRLHHIEAVVIEGNYPVHVLLGMSFLGNLDIHREGQIMKIKKKW